MAKTAKRTAELRKPRKLKARYGTYLHTYTHARAPQATERMTDAERAQFGPPIETTPVEDKNDLKALFANLATAMQGVNTVISSIARVLK